MPQYAILRFAKHKGAPAEALEAHHECRKEQYTSNPDIDTSKSKYNFDIVRPEGRYRQEIDSRIAAARCRARKDSTRFVDTFITASPPFFSRAASGRIFGPSLSGRRTSSAGGWASTILSRLWYLWTRKRHTYPRTRSRISRPASESRRSVWRL